MGKGFARIAVSLTVSTFAAVSFVSGPSVAFAVEDGAGAAAEARTVEDVAAEEAPLASTDEVSSGVVKGDGWSLEEDGVLTIEKDIAKPEGLRYEWQPYAERIREVRLAEGVSAIPNSAFASTTWGVNPVEYPNLTKFTACSTLKIIGWDVFSDTRSLTEVHLNDGLELLSHSAFANTGIESIELPPSVTIGGDCFSGCSKLGGTLVIPGGARFEDGSNGTFYGTGVESVVVEEGVTWIPSSAFNGCPNLKRAYLPKSLVQIGGTQEADPGIFYDSFDPCLIVGYKGTTAEQYVEHWLEMNPEQNKGLAFHAIDGEEHEFGPWETASEATCTSAGTRKHVCTVCGTERTESLSALGHVWGEGVVTAEPTESAEGVRTFTCGRCAAMHVEAIAKLEREDSEANGGMSEGTGDGLPATGDPASVLGLLTASGVVAAAAGGALRRKR